MKKWDINKEVAVNWLSNRDIKIIWVSGKPTLSGRTDFFKVISHNNNDKNRFSDLTYFVSQLCNIRYNEKGDCLSISGYGYSKKDSIIERISYTLKKLEIEINYYIE